MTDRDARPNGEVLKDIKEQVTPEPDGIQNGHGNIWTSRSYHRSQAKKDKTPYSVDELDAAIETLDENGEIIRWHGLIAPATDRHLQAIIDNEQRCEFSRSLLIDQCRNRQEVAHVC